MPQADKGYQIYFIELVYLQKISFRGTGLYTEDSEPFGAYKKNFLFQMQIVYNFFIRLYSVALRLASIFHPKAKLWLAGRKDLLEKIALSLDHEADHVWFHCASTGEFEQGRPVIEKFRKENPEYKIVLTFFSPSGYELRQNYPLADHVFYLPHDTPANARKFMEYVNPRLAVFVKYEYWFNYLNVLHEKNIPVVFISAVFRPGQMFFKWWGSWFRKKLTRATYFFVQDKSSQKLLYSIGIRNVIVSGDTRFDRVFEISRQPSSFPKVEKFIQGSVIFMAGSTWPADDKLLVRLINEDKSNVKFILVPHEIGKSAVKKLAESLKPSVVKYSDESDAGFDDAKVLIVDQMGMLSSLYQYASLAYVGGGFGKGIHNTLEAAAFGMPVIFGPRHEKFTEAVGLIKIGGALSVANYDDLKNAYITLLGDYQLLRRSSDVARNYVYMKRGATDKIIIFLNTIINPMGFKAQSLNLLNMN